MISKIKNNLKSRSHKQETLTKGSHLLEKVTSNPTFRRRVSIEVGRGKR